MPHATASCCGESVQVAARTSRPWWRARTGTARRTTPTPSSWPRRCAAP